MARVGVYDPEIDARSWFDGEIRPEAWFTYELITPPSTTDVDAATATLVWNALEAFVAPGPVAVVAELATLVWGAFEAAAAGTGFLGTAVVTPISQNCVRITGLSLAGDATGQIVFDDRAVIPFDAVAIPGEGWDPYAYPPLFPILVVQLADMVQVNIVPVTDITTPVPISVTKTGTTHDTFAIALHNDAMVTSPEIEIYVSKAR